MNGGDIMKKKALSLAPVSYTHLDVYKRQGPEGHEAGAPCPGAFRPAAGKGAGDKGEGTEAGIYP